MLIMYPTEQETSAHWQRDWNPEITKTTTILYPMSLHIDGGVNLWHCGEIPFVFHNVDLVAGSYGGSQDAYDLQDVMAKCLGKLCNHRRSKWR